tara:strand:- start:222 stop:1394 length:1173 start_codon:yes stop_codon:yes gene_type:complete
MEKKKNEKIKLETKMAQALRFLDLTTGAVSPSIQLSSTYARDDNYKVRKPYWYRRDGNETTDHAESMLSELEGAEDSILFASGMSAVTAIIDNLSSGAHVVLPKVMYHGVLQQFGRYQELNRLTISYYEAGNLADLESSIIDGKTELVWVETPNNPDWEVTDIAEAAKITHNYGAKLLTDCTATPPCLTRALELGSDISFHSATKFLNGHSDATAGVLSTLTMDDKWENLYLIRKLQGTVLNSFEAWLLIRGLRTLFLRVEKACDNAIKVAHYFENHDQIESVLYPGLLSHPGHETSKLQTNGKFGSMLSIIIKGDEKIAIDVARYCEVFYPATSLGGVESLIEHRKTVSGEGFPVHPRLLRLSIGIEDSSDLIWDFEQALSRAFKATAN